MKRFLLYSLCFLVCFAYLIVTAEEKGVQENNPFYPFVDNGDGTITDTITGLMWTKKAYCIELPSSERKDIQHDRPIKLDVAGGKYSNWRFPTLLELKNLYRSLGMMTSYKATDPKDRTYSPFEWPREDHLSKTSEQEYGERKKFYPFDFGKGETLYAEYVVSCIRYVRSEDEKLERCPKCNGKGLCIAKKPVYRTQPPPPSELYPDRMPWKWVKCPVCKGEGKTRWYGRYLDDPITCYQCEGKGQVVEDPMETCDKCHGTGWIRVEKKEGEVQTNNVSGDVPKEQSKKKEELGSIRIISEPEYCDVYVDADFVGSTPATIKLKSGAYTIGVKKDGYKLYEKEIHIFGGSELTLRAVLIQE